MLHLICWMSLLNHDGIGVVDMKNRFLFLALILALFVALIPSGFAGIHSAMEPAAESAVRLHCVALGDTCALVSAEWGEPARVIGKWSVYRNASYTEFGMVCFGEDKAEAVYTMRSGWDAEALTKCGNVKEYADQNDNDKKYAVLYTLPDVAVPFDELMIFELTNGFRGTHGVAPLAWSDKLTAVARAHSRDMYDNTYFNHFSLNGCSPTDRAKNAGYTYSCGENISAGYKDSISSVHGWINSSSHRRNMLHTIYKEMGVGNYSGEKWYRNFSTQLFGATW